MLCKYKPLTFVSSRKFRKVWGVSEVTEGTSKSTSHEHIPLATNIDGKSIDINEELVFPRGALTKVIPKVKARFLFGSPSYEPL